ncbi:MAG: MlaD family protein, partial [Prosthecobacter sp.]
MSKTASPTLIGIFTLVGIVLAAGSLILFGASRFFEKTSRIMLYFDQSANGLLVGSEARFGGVRIGRVASIRVLVDSKENRKIIPVVVELSEKDLRFVGSTAEDKIDFTTDEGVKSAVANGLRARMKQQSLLTGQLYIEFDIAPDKPGFIFKPERQPPFPAVPTMGTELDAIISGISDGLKKFNDLDLATNIKDMR